MIPTKEMTPFVPVSPEEIIEDVHQACGIGITMVHLHARERDGSPTYKKNFYRDIIEGIRKFSRDLVVCVSLSGRNFKEFEQRTEPLQLDGESKPDMGSLTLSSLNFNREASVNTPAMIQSLAAEMNGREIMPELEVFDIGMLNYAKYLERKKLLTPPHYFNLIFGNIACAQADPLHVAVAIRELPKDSYWSLAGIGNSQLLMNSLSIIFGGGVRTGLEDNIWLDRGRTRLARNADLIRRIHVLADTHERRIMSPADLRRLLNLNPGKGSYGRSCRKDDKETGFIAVPRVYDHAVTGWTSSEGIS